MMTANPSTDVVNSLMAALERDPRVDLHKYPVNAVLEDGSLVLEGMQENIAAKRAAARAAHRVAGNLAVVDRLRVTAVRFQEDGALRAEVISTLTQEPVFTEYGMRVRRNGDWEVVRDVGAGQGGHIDIEIGDGVVTLSGEAGSLSHRRLAEVLVWWTAGCQLVENRLRVVPAEAENDGELIDAIRMVLEKDPLVHADQVLVRAQSGVVSLGGYVASEQERKLAVLDVWCVPGVHDVIDEIRARS